jgi:maltose alpha-D-glucosyltransferase/alpha-amylase
LDVYGFRVDALPFVISSKGPGITAFGDHPEYLVAMRDVLSWHRGDAVFMAEANVPPDQTLMYFGEGDRINVIFNFFVNQHLWLALGARAGAADPGCVSRCSVVYRLPSTIRYWKDG